MAKKEKVTEKVMIKAPNFQIVTFHIQGIAPLVIQRFGKEERQEIHDKQEIGDIDKNKKKKRKPPKDFKAKYKQALYTSSEGWHGIPAIAFRNALISACRLVNFTMTSAKLAIFIVADGFDADDEMKSLVKITKGEPKYFETNVRLQTGVPDLRVRPMWEIGWEANVTVRFDADQMSLQDISNLIMRAGIQVGIGEGRPDSKKSYGQDWGLFKLVEEDN